MKLIKNNFLLNNLLIVLFLSLIFSSLSAQESKFTVVLDAGHGGHDPGAIGVITREKDINLAVVLHLGSLIDKHYKDVKVVYTRKTDKYLTLQERADIVNNNHADLFICIHTNAAKSSAAYGAETFTLGLAKSKANLDVAMRENSVILLEEDYKTKYKGFDPGSVDSYIMFEFMQDKYIDKSIEFSSIVQTQFVEYCKRSDRGVRQAGFWVLHRSACPSVLVELGFISNRAEERYLASTQGRQEMGSAIFNAFVDYKRTHDKRMGRQAAPVQKIAVNDKHRDTVTAERVMPQINTETVKPVQMVVAADIAKENPVKENHTEDDQRKLDINHSVTVPVFKVQLFATSKILKPDAPEFKGIKNVECFTEGGLNKYTVGSETDFSKIENIRAGILSKFPQAFVIAFIGTKKISSREALIMIGK